MKTLFLSIIFMTQAAWSSGIELRYGSAQPEQFQFAIKENPMNIGVKKGNSAEYIIKLEHTVIDAAKINVRITKDGGEAVVQELLIVATTVGNTEQDITVFAPIRSSDIVLSSKIDPVCKIKNFGDFYWDNEQDLMKKLKLVEKNKTASLEVLVNSSETQKAPVFKNSGCSFRLLKN